LEEKIIIDQIKNERTRPQGFARLVEAYQERIYWHTRKMVIDHDDANDLTQDIFVKVWKNIQSFREDSRLFTWIYRIATNECLNFLKKKKNKFFISLQDTTHELEEKLDQQPLIDGEEIEIKLQKAILSLPEKQRLVFNMKYFDEMKFSEIAAITETSEGALKANYHHARKKIEENLKTTLNY